MNVLGFTLGHDSSAALVVDGRIEGILEAERYFRQKRYKLHCHTLTAGRQFSGFQYTDIADLERYLEFIARRWGKSFDAVAVQNQGRADEFENLLLLLRREAFTFRRSVHVDHHLAHAALAFYTSPFPEAVVLSYDGMGNDGQTVIFRGMPSGITYVERNPCKFGQSYNNLGFTMGVKPDVSGSTAGKTMGLAAYGQLRSDWLPNARAYVRDYRKLPYREVEGLNDYGKGHRINSAGLNDIPELAEFLVETPAETIVGRLRSMLGSSNGVELHLPGPEHPLAQDLAHTVQQAWTMEVMDVVRPHQSLSGNLCVVGGCALNGITNYRMREEELFEQFHFVPNPTDCGLSAGAALLAYHHASGAAFQPSGTGLSPYLGSEPFDLDELPRFKDRYSWRQIPNVDLPRVLAQLLFRDRLIGVIRGKYEVGPRALGNRSILCNPLNREMRTILNERVKRREWYRPFAPIVCAEDAHRYFTNDADVPYMSVICCTKCEYRELLPAITHVDGSARLQTLRRDQLPWLHETLREFEKLSGVPILLNTSFNPGGEPILNFCAVGLEMLNKSGLDLVLIDDTLFCRRGCEALLQDAPAA